MERQPTHIDYSKNVSEIVKSDYRTAEVFKKYGINYCCGGQIPLQEVCTIRQINLASLQDDLEKATNTVSVPNNLQFNEWKLDFLIDYVGNVYHCYLKQALPELETSLLSFINGHKEKYPMLAEVLSLFQELSSLLTKHVQQEDEIIFPYIKQIENTHRRKEVYGSLFIRTLRKPLTSVLENEHQQIRKLLIQLRQQTDNYNFPAHACTKHQVIYNKLRELDNHLVQQQHLENNILYPKAVEMEQELLQSNVQ